MLLQRRHRWTTKIQVLNYLPLLGFRHARSRGSSPSISYAAAASGFASSSVQTTSSADDESLMTAKCSCHAIHTVSILLAQLSWDCIRSERYRRNTKKILMHARLASMFLVAVYMEERLPTARALSSDKRRDDGLSRLRVVLKRRLTAV